MRTYQTYGDIASPSEVVMEWKDPIRMVPSSRSIVRSIEMGEGAGVAAGPAPLSTVGGGDGVISITGTTVRSGGAGTKARGTSQFSGASPGAVPSRHGTSSVASFTSAGSGSKVSRNSKPSCQPPPCPPVGESVVPSGSLKRSLGVQEGGGVSPSA